MALAGLSRPSGQTDGADEASDTEQPLLSTGDGNQQVVIVFIATEKKTKKPSTRPTGGAHLDPLLGSDAAHSDGGLRPVQQNLQLAALGVLAGADADGDHPAGTLLTWQTTHAPIRRGHGRRHPGLSVICDRVGISFCSVQWFSFTNLCILFMCCVLTLCSVSLSFYLLPGSLFFNSNYP